MQAVELPRFTSHEGNVKFNTPLQESDVDRQRFQPWVDRFLAQFAAERGGPANVRVLDFGCGRGATVALLRRKGFRAYGIDVDPKYLDNARALLGGMDEGYPMVSQPGSDGRSVFPDGFFDLIMSDQVFEHVADLGGVLSEMKRLTRVGGAGLHIFPAKFSIVEPHVFLPCVHWFPKGKARRAAIRAMLAAGLGADYFREYPLAQRTEIFSHFSDSETFYRPYSALRGSFARYGFGTKNAAIAKFRARGGLAARLFALPMVGDFGAWLFVHFGSVCLITARQADV